MIRKSFFLFSLLGCLTLILAACGSSGGSGSSGNVAPTATTAPPTAAATPTSSSAALIKTATATVSGKSVTILTGTDGKTLYYFKPDTASKVACTGGCASTWPPLLMSDSGTPSSATPLPGVLKTVTSANGTQVEYNGHPLYMFSGDSSAGQTNGEGIGNVWFVATPDLTVQAGSGSTYGNGY